MGPEEVMPCAVITTVILICAIYSVAAYTQNASSNWLPNSDLGSKINSKGVGRTGNGTNALDSDSAKYTEFLKKIKAKYEQRPGNTARNEEFEQHIQKVAKAIQLGTKELNSTMDVYVNFTIYDDLRQELEAQINKNLQQVAENLTDSELSSKCKKYFLTLQQEYKQALTETNEKKKTKVDPALLKCKDKQKNPKAIAGDRSVSNDTNAFRDIMNQYKEKPWGNAEYPEFDKYYKQVSEAASAGTSEAQAEVLKRFTDFDKLRVQLDTILDEKIEEGSKHLIEAQNPKCKRYYKKLMADFQAALLESNRAKETKIHDISMDCGILDDH